MRITQVITFKKVEKGGEKHASMAVLRVWTYGSSLLVSAGGKGGKGELP